MKIAGLQYRIAVFWCHTKIKVLIIVSWITLAFVVSTFAHTPPVEIVVQSGARQAFEGWGFSQVLDSGYTQLSPERRQKINQLLIQDLPFTNILRIWFCVSCYAEHSNESGNLQPFIEPYLDLIRDMQRQGQDRPIQLLLAPISPPQWMMESRNHRSLIAFKAIPEHAQIISNFLLDIRTQYGIEFAATGIQNEPENWLGAEMAASLKALRKALDAAQLTSVKLIGPETSNADGYSADILEAIRQDEVAWKSLDGIATHSYNMAANNQIATIAQSTGKAYWMTESGDNGYEYPGNRGRAAIAVARFLNDMNHYVTHWVWFIGAARFDQANDNGVRLIPFKPEQEGKWYFPNTKYYYFKQLAKVFDRGAKFRKSYSSIDGEMLWTYGQKPHLISATAQNPDHTWGIAVANITDKQEELYPPQDYLIKLRIAELADTPDQAFDLYRSFNGTADPRALRIHADHGQLTFPIKSTEMVSLRSCANPS
jgi:hypothetical protein